MMTRFDIHINTVPDCRKYCELLDSFSFDGYLLIGARVVSLYDIESIIEFCYIKPMHLFVVCHDSGTLKLIEAFLLESGILIQNAALTKNAR
jgi:hypothetical protein